MLKLPPDRYSRIVISLRILLPVVALAGLWATFKFTPEPPREEEIAPAGKSDFASLRNSEFGTVTDGGIEVQVESELTEWKNGVALSKNVTAKVADPIIWLRQSELRKPSA